MNSRTLLALGLAGMFLVPGCSELKRETIEHVTFVVRKGGQVCLDSQPFWAGGIASLPPDICLTGSWARLFRPYAKPLSPLSMTWIEWDEAVRKGTPLPLSQVPRDSLPRFVWGIVATMRSNPLRNLYWIDVTNIAVSEIEYLPDRWLQGYLALSGTLEQLLAAFDLDPSLDKRERVVSLVQSYLETLYEMRQVNEKPPERTFSSKLKRLLKDARWTRDVRAGVENDLEELLLWQVQDMGLQLPGTSNAQKRQAWKGRTTFKQTRERIHQRLTALGLQVDDLPPRVRQTILFPYGVRISAIAPGSPADRAGLRAGDIVLKIRNNKDPGSGRGFLMWDAGWMERFLVHDVDYEVYELSKLPNAIWWLEILRDEKRQLIDLPELWVVTE